MGKERILEIDFIKGLAIISVILLHTIPDNIRLSIFSSLHIGQAVPIFIATTYFLGFRSLKDSTNPINDWFVSRRIISVVKRVIIPWLFIVFLQIIFSNYLFHLKFDIRELISGGGYGPGSYYIWVYFQVWLTIPFFYIIFVQFNKYIGIVTVFLVGLLLNYIFYKLELSASLYRLSLIRYIPLSAISWILFSREEYNNTEKIIIFLCSILSVIYLLTYSKILGEPFVLDYGWKSQQWPSYFWTLLLIYLIRYAYNHIGDQHFFQKFIIWMGKNSWLIFLTQMLYLSFISINSFLFIQNSLIRKFIFLLSTFIFSLGFTYILKKIDKLIHIASKKQCEI